MIDDAALRAELDRVERRLDREREIRLEAEAIAERATARLYQSDRLKSAFLETVSHELRTPLVAIIGFADVLNEGWDTLDDARRRDFVERIRRNGAVLQTMVEQLLDFTRLDRDGFRPALTQISLAELVPKIVDQLAVVLVGHRARLQVGLDVIAIADPGAVAHILTNLITNAAAYSPEGTTVTIGATSRDGWAVLQVADEGPGVPADERPLIFERFYRGHHAAVLRTHGSGIGLALVKELADQMGGGVTVGEAKGGGAIFSVRLPTAATAPQPAAS